MASTLTTRERCGSSGQRKAAMSKLTGRKKNFTFLLFINGISLKMGRYVPAPHFPNDLEYRKKQESQLSELFLENPKMTLYKPAHVIK